MTYQEAVAEVVVTYRDEIEADLTAARQALERSRARFAEDSRRVESYEALLAFDTDEFEPGDAGSGEKLTLHVAMRRVLEDAPNHMLRAVDIATEIQRRALYRMRDGRPVEAQQIHARVGHYPDDFGREGTFIKLQPAK